MSQHTFFVNELATLRSLNFHTFILRLSIDPCTFLSLTPKNLNLPHFDFRGNYEKYLPGVPPVPYFDQSVAYD